MSELQLADFTTIYTLQCSHCGSSHSVKLLLNENPESILDHFADEGWKVRQEYAEVKDFQAEELEIKGGHRAIYCENCHARRVWKEN